MTCPEAHTRPSGCGVCGWDGAHATRLVGRPPTVPLRAACTCGWWGPPRRGVDARWEATADSDDHRNEQEHG